ncbi:MAG: hypothetical protein Q7J84_16230 [Sulfuricaulis sp.]|nr:hypothetical protein [Sulfuricaulis sp.]
MKNTARMFVVFAFSFVSFLANAEIVKVPVDPSVTAASGVPGYDQFVVRSRTIRTVVRRGCGFFRRNLLNTRDGGYAVNKYWSAASLAGTTEVHVLSGDVE